MMVNFEWTEMNDETFKIIKNENSKYSENVLAVGDKGAILVGRISKNENPKWGYSVECYLGGGFDNVIKFVKITDLI